MAYPTLPDRRMAWDIDGTKVYLGANINGPQYLEPAGSMTNANSFDTPDYNNQRYFGSASRSFWFFFPELRIVTAYWGWWYVSQWGGYNTVQSISGSADSTNGLDGTWESAYLPAGLPSRDYAYSWRSSIKPCSFTQPIKVFRISASYGDDGYYTAMAQQHIYGHKASWETPNDIVFVDASSGIEFPIDLDWGDLPLSAPVKKQFKVKNVSSTMTANTIQLTCSDTDFTISEDDVTYGTTINLSSLTAGSSSSTYYVKGIPPADGLPGPRAPRIKLTVGSWT